MQQACIATSSMDRQIGGYSIGLTIPGKLGYSKKEEKIWVNARLRDVSVFLSPHLLLFKWDPIRERRRWERSRSKWKLNLGENFILQNFGVNHFLNTLASKWHFMGNLHLKIHFLSKTHLKTFKITDDIEPFITLSTTLMVVKLWPFF